MTKKLFDSLIMFLGAAFAVLFCVIVLPPLFESEDLIGAFASGFVNPFSTGYSLDAIFCALILICWALYEKKTLGIKHGWVVIPLSAIPGVATAFAVYLILRSRQIARIGSERPK